MQSNRFAIYLNNWRQCRKHGNDGTISQPFAIITTCKFVQQNLLTHCSQCLSTGLWTHSFPTSILFTVHENTLYFQLWHYSFQHSECRKTTNGVPSNKRSNRKLDINLIFLPVHSSYACWITGSSLSFFDIWKIISGFGGNWNRPIGGITGLSISPSSD